MTLKMPGLISGAYASYLVCQRSCRWDSVKESEMGRLGKLIIQVDPNVLSFFFNSKY